MKKRFLCLSLIFAMTAAQVMPVAAARKDEVQAEKAETQSKLAQAESKADDLEAKKNALLNEIDSIDKSLVQTIAQIDILKGEISDKEDAITETKEKLEEAEAEKETQYESMKKRIQYLYENGGTKAWAQMLLESGNILDMVGKAEYTEKMYQYDRDELKKMKGVVTQVTDLGNQLTQEKAELEDMKQVQEEQQATLETQLEQKKATASDYESQIASVEAQAQEYRNLIEQQNAELKKIQEEEARAAEAARKAQEAAEKARQEAAQNQTQAVESTNNTTAEEVQSNTGSSNTESSSNDSSNNNVSTESDPEPVEEESTSNSGSSYSATGEAVVAYASQFIGNPYVYGGNSLTNGIDCSGFVQQVFAHFGYSLPRVSDAQAGAGRGISYSESRAGDIIVYSGHVAILTGDGGIVHASNSAPYPQGGIKYSSNALYRPYIAVRRIVE
ncbi:MAG: NlpC/P60 family protein [Blautia sp.]